MKRKVDPTADGHYVIIDGRKWRATNPNLPEDERKRLVSDLMRARRDVGKAMREGDKEAEEEARARVHRAKVALGERGPKWWAGASPEPPKAEAPKPKPPKPKPPKPKPPKRKAPKKPSA